MRTIVHCDLNNFYATVEMLKNPDLRGKAIAVCGDPAERSGIVLAKSEPAKKCGVKTGMPNWQAKQLCPDIIIVMPHHNDYSRYSKIVQQIYYRYSDLVESFGGDECWIDITNSMDLLRRDHGITNGREFADHLRQVVFDETGLTISAGVSWNKTFAKLGSDYKKPDATTEINKDNYKQIVWPLPASSMLYVGRKTFAHLERLNIKTIGDIANANPEMLKGHFGINANKMVQMARGEDAEPVSSFIQKREIKSVGNGTTLPHDLTKLCEVNQVVYLLSEEVAWRLRKKDYKGTTVSLSVRGTNLEWSGAQETISIPTNSSKTIHEIAMKIFEKHWKLPTPVMSLRVAVSNLTRDTRSQMSLFDTGQEERNDKISNVFDTVRKKYGTKSIAFATAVHGEFNMQFEVLDEF